MHTMLKHQIYSEVFRLRRGSSAPSWYGDGLEESKEGSCSGHRCQQTLALVTSLSREILLLFCTDEAGTKLGMGLGEGQIERDPTWSDLKVYHSVTAIFFN